MHRLFVVLDEDINVASAVRQMNLHEAEVIIVSKDGKAVEIVTDSDILDKVVGRFEIIAILYIFFCYFRK